MSYKVIQWATGGIGKAAIEGVADHPDLELVGCWVHSDDKVGQDAGIIAGIRELGVTATNSMQDILAMDADCVMYAPAMAAPEDVKALLESGKHVVTPTGDWFYAPRNKSNEALWQACEIGNTVLHGTGIHPGGFTERFPLILSSMQRCTNYVRSEEFSDIRTYNAPQVVRDIMLFGKTAEEVKQSFMPGYMATGFYQSIQMVADELRIPLDDFKTTHELGLATAPIDSPIGVIEPGQVAAQRITWAGMRHGKPVIEAVVNWLMGEEHFDQDWNFGPQGPHYAVTCKGDPDLHTVYHGTHPHTIEEGLKRNAGIVVTAMHCVNSIPYVCQLKPGIRNYLDLPMVCGRAAPDLL